MHARRRLARATCSAVLQPHYAASLQMVEDKDAARARHLLDDLLGLRVIDPANLVIIPEILYCATLLDERETLRVDRHVGRNRPHIVNPHCVRIVSHIRALLTLRRLKGIIARPLGHWTEIIQFGLDIGQAVDITHVRFSLVVALGWNGLRTAGICSTPAGPCVRIPALVALGPA